MTDFEEGLKELVTNKKEKLIEVLNVFSEKGDIETKTDIPQPLNFSLMEAIAHHLKEDRGMTKSGKILNNIIKFYRYNRVSHDRKGREELLQALSNMSNKPEKEDEEKALKDKLTEAK